MSNGNDYSKGFAIGALIGGAAGALTALLLAPKSGKDLRKDISETSHEYYNKAHDYLSETEKKVGHQVQTSVNEGRVKAQNIINSAKEQANEILYAAENVLKEAKGKAGAKKEDINEKISDVREATKAGVSTFKEEYNKK